MLRVATFNINGIRACRKRGFDEWLARRECDVVAVQEVRCRVADLAEDSFGDYHYVYDPGSIAGRNGVAILTRTPPAAIRTWGADVWVGDQQSRHLEPAPPRVPIPRRLREFISEGRYVEVDLADRQLTVASLYLPKGGLPAHLQVPGRMREKPDGGAKYDRKIRFLTGFAKFLTATRRAAAAEGREFLLMGDFNVAHDRWDVRNWRTSHKTEGFLPEERDWLSALHGRTLVDVVRLLHGDVDGPYSWWSWLGNAFANDTGWRIDYHLATAALAGAAVRGDTDRDPTPDQRLSDHAPVVVDYDY